MEGYGIEIHTERMGTIRYRLGGNDHLGVRLPLTEAEEKAHELLIGRNAVHVTVGDGEHEFRMWAHDAEGRYLSSNFDRPGLRWADWYVDAEINGRRWRYQPIADIDTFSAAEDVAERACGLYPDVTRVWVGASDGSEEFEREVHEER